MHTILVGFRWMGVWWGIEVITP